MNYFLQRTAHSAQRTAHSAQRTATAAAVSAAFCLTFFSPEMAQGQGHWNGSGNTTSPIYRTGTVHIGPSSTASCTGAFLNIDEGLNINPATNQPSIFFGCARLLHTTGANNLFLGFNSGGFLSTGAENVSMGLGSGAGLTSGSQNVFLGVNAGATNSTNNSNVYIGFECGGVNDGDDNVALGAEAMTGSLNQNCVFLGRLSGAHAINNNGSIYIGKDAGRENDHVTNVMIGYESGYGSTRSNENVFLGTKTGRTLKTGGANTLIGDHAGFSMSTNETNNTFVGHQSGSAFDSGDNNTALGGSTVVNPGVNNSTAIGFNSTVCSSSTIVIGSNNGSRGKEAVIIGGCQPVWAGVGDFEVIGGDGYAVNWYGVSDVRLKTNIKKIENPFQIINSLNGYLYNFKTNNDLGIKLPVEQQSGLLAQEIEKVFPTAIKQNSDGYLSVNYSSLIPVLIEGLKQLEEENIKLNRRIKEIEAVDEKQDIISLNNIGRLNQNKPNPFYQETVFSYQINNEYNHAEIKIFDLSGKLKESITIPMDSLSVTYANNNLLPGIYAYTLFVDGLSVDTKTLVITD